MGSNFSQEIKSDPPLLSIILLNYNGVKFLEKCLISLMEQTFQDFEVLLVDNASSDSSVEYAHEFKEKMNFEKMRIIQNSLNLGYSGGNNIGCEYASGKFLLFLNVDTWLEKNCFSYLINSAESNSNIKVWQPKILNADGSLRTIGNNCDIYVGKAEPTEWAVFYASGACLLIENILFKKLGGFDEILFAYNEDLDLGWRVRLLGYDVGCSLNAICYHVGSFSWNSAMPPQKFYFLERNRLRVFLKNYSVSNVITRFLFLHFLISLRGTYFAFVTHNPSYITKTINAFFWNLTHIKDTINNRKLIQTYRVVNDTVIEQSMIKYSSEIRSFLNKFLRKKAINY